MVADIVKMNKVIDNKLNLNITSTLHIFLPESKCASWGITAIQI